MRVELLVGDVCGPEKGAVVHGGPIQESGFTTDKKVKLLYDFCQAPRPGRRGTGRTPDGPALPGDPHGVRRRGLEGPAPVTLPGDLRRAGGGHQHHRARAAARDDQAGVRPVREPARRGRPAAGRSRSRRRARPVGAPDAPGEPDDGGRDRPDAPDRGGLGGAGGGAAVRHLPCGRSRSWRWLTRASRGRASSAPRSPSGRRRGGCRTCRRTTCRGGEAQKASATSGGAKRTSSDPWRQAAIRPASRRADDSRVVASASRASASSMARSRRGSAPRARPTSVIHASRTSGSRDSARSTSSALMLPEPSQTELSGASR